MERAAVPYFGMKAYGVHINGYVKDPVTNEILLWVAKRSKTKSTFPGIFLRKTFSSFSYTNRYFTFILICYLSLEQYFFTTFLPIFL